MESYIECLFQLIMKALDAYFAFNNKQFLPDTIIIFRDGDYNDDISALN